MLVADEGRGDELVALAVGDTVVGSDAECDGGRVRVEVSEEEPTWDADATAETAGVGVRVTLGEDDGDWDAVGEWLGLAVGDTDAVSS